MICQEESGHTKRACARCNVWTHPECWWAWFEHWLRDPRRRAHAACGTICGPIRGTICCTICRRADALQVHEWIDLKPKPMEMSCSSTMHTQLARMIRLINHVRMPRDTRLEFIVEVFSVIGQYKHEYMHHDGFSTSVRSRLDEFIGDHDVPVAFRSRLEQIRDELALA